MIVLPTKARNSICKYLSISELLGFSLISSAWYFGIEALPTFKKRVWLKLNDACSADQLESLESARDYENLEVVSEFWNWNLDSKFLSKLKWKRVKLMIQKFVTSEELIQCLEIFSKTAVSLKLKMIKEAGEESDAIFEKFLEFPFLESLHVEDCSSVVLKPFMKQKKLKALKLDFILPSSTNDKLKIFMLELIISLDNLVELEVNQMSADDLFSFNIGPHVKFHLKNLTLWYPTSEVAAANILLFMKCQGDWLKHIKLCSWDDPSTVYQIWNSMTQLESFYQSDGTKKLNFSDVDPSLMRVFVNESMKKLHFHFTSPEIPTNWLKPLYLASPFLEDIQFPRLCNGFANLLSYQTRIRTKFCFISCDDNGDIKED